MRNVSLLLPTVFIASLALAGCEVGPDYVSPQTVSPQHWESDKTASNQTTLDQKWWDNFDDPILTSLIDQASANNLDLKIAESRIAQTRAGVSAATASLLPTGDIKGSATRNANQQALPGGSGSSFNQLLKKPYNLYQTGFDASWELDLFGGNHRAEESAEAQMQASEASRDDVLVSLRAEVARTYILIRQYQAQASIIDDRLAADEKTLSLTTQRFKLGEVSHLDAIQAEATLDQDRQQQPATRSSLAQAEYSLDVLLGAQPGTAHKQTAKPIPMPIPNKNVVLIAPASVVAERPDIRAAERKLAAATAQQGVAIAKFFPNISLTGFFGALNTTTNNLFTGGSESWMAGSSVLWPILSYGSLSANLDAANAQQQEALATYQKAIISALADVERSLTAYNEQQNFLQSAQYEAEQMRHARSIAQERFQNGLTSRLEVLAADHSLYAAEDRLTKAQSDATQNLIALYKSLGGGWSSDQNL